MERLERFVFSLFAAPLLLANVATTADIPAATDLNWIAGHWCAVQGSEQIEEYWLPARGGVLLGLGRTTNGERNASFEFMRIVLSDGVPTFIAQPQGGSPVPFKRTAGGADWARFENPAHDFPTRVEYRRDGERLRAHVAGPGKNGKESVLTFRYERCERTS